MDTNSPEFRPLGPPTHLGDFIVRLRLGSLRCACGHIFKQHEAQPVDEGGLRFACDYCGTDHLEAVRS